MGRIDASTSENLACLGVMSVVFSAFTGRCREHVVRKQAVSQRFASSREGGLLCKPVTATFMRMENSQDDGTTHLLRRNWSMDDSGAKVPPLHSKKVPVMNLHEVLGGPVR